MNAKQAAKLAKKSEPEVSRRERKQEKEAVRQESKAAAKAKAKKDAEFEKRFTRIQKDIEYAAQNAKREARPNTEYDDDQNRIIRALTKDGFKVQISRNYWNEPGFSAYGPTYEDEPRSSDCYVITW